jgi:hypothetical protein
LLVVVAIVALLISILLPLWATRVDLLLIGGVVARAKDPTDGPTWRERERTGDAPRLAPPVRRLSAPRGASPLIVAQSWASCAQIVGLAVARCSHVRQRVGAVPGLSLDYARGA